MCSSDLGKNEWYTTHGDVFPIHGATMEPFGRHNGQRSFPSEDRCKSSPEWNHYRIVATNGVLRLSVNGKEVSGGKDCNYRKGYLALESEGAPVEFRNIQIKELPSSGVSAELSAPLDLGWRPLFTGLDFRGWKTNSITADQWSVPGELLHVKGSGAAKDAILWSDADFADAEFVVDCRPAKAADGEQPAKPFVYLRGEGTDALAIPLTGSEAGKFQRYVITTKGTDVIVTVAGKEAGRSTIPPGFGSRRGFGLLATGGAAEFMNLYIREL